MGHYPGRQPSPLTPARRQALLASVLAALPGDMQLKGVNFARGSASSYWLLQQSVGNKPYWLTLRLATHPLWLAHAQQLELTWPDFRDFQGLTGRLHWYLRPQNVVQWRYELSPLDRALLQFLLYLAGQQLVFFVRLPAVLAAQHKGAVFDLTQNLKSTQLLLGDRNNVNRLLLPVKSVPVQQKLMTFYGMNLLFSQFTAHQLLRLMPTSQWLQAILQVAPAPSNWPALLRQTYGPQFWQLGVRALAKQKKRQG